MISFANIFLIAAVAFSYDQWHGKRAMMTCEAERLREAYSNCVARLEMPAEGVVVPMETFEDGSVKLIVSAKKAQFFLDTGLVWAQEVVIKKYDEERNLVTQIDAKECLIDRNTKNGWIEGEAKIEYGKTTFRGKGMYFSSAEGYVIMMEDSSIETTDLKFGGAL